MPINLTCRESTRPRFPLNTIGIGTFEDEKLRHLEWCIDGGPVSGPQPNQFDPPHEHHASLVMADIVESTHHAQELDPRTLHSLQMEFADAVDGIIEAHGGLPEEHKGDNVLGVFEGRGIGGLGRRDALRAALDIHRAVREVGHGSNAWGLRRPLRVRIGITAGEVILGRRSRGMLVVTGQAVNRLARLTSAAAPGEIVSDQDLPTDQFGDYVPGVDVRDLREFGWTRVQCLRRPAPVSSDAFADSPSTGHRVNSTFDLITQ